MKDAQKLELSFGDLIKVVYQVWGSGRAEKMLRQAISSGSVIFREPPIFLASSARELSMLSKVLQGGLELIYARAARN